MADNSVDSIILEIESSTVQADAGLQKLASALSSIKKSANAVKDTIPQLNALKTALNQLTIVTNVVNPLESVSKSLKTLTTSLRETSFSNLKKELEDIESLSVGENLEKITTEHKDLSEEVKKQSSLNTGSLETIVNTLNGLHVDPGAGDSVKKVGSGFNSIANATKKLEGTDLSTLDKLSAAVAQISTSVGSLGDNNRISIKIDAEGVKTVAKPLENAAKNSKDFTRAQQEAEKAAQQLKAVLGILNTDFGNGSQNAMSYAQAIKTLQNFLTQASNGKYNVDSAIFEKARQKVEELKASYSEFRKEVSQGMRSTGVDQMSRSIQTIIDKQKEYSKTVSDMDSGKVGFDWKEYQKATVELEKFNNAQKVYQGLAKLGTPSGLQSLADMCKNASAELNKLAGMGLKLLKVFSMPFTGVISHLKKQIMSIAPSFKSMTKTVQGYLKKMSDFWKRTMKTFTFMLVRKAITAIIDNIKEAVDSLALWSKAMDTPFNESISNIVADFKYMARSILAAVEPLINAVAPLLNKLADMFSNLMSKVAQFFAALTGQSYYSYSW